MKPTCGCDRRVEARGLCPQHYQQLWRAKPKPPCTSPGCTRPQRVLSWGLCSACYQRVRRAILKANRVTALSNLPNRGVIVLTTLRDELRTTAAQLRAPGRREEQRPQLIHPHAIAALATWLEAEAINDVTSDNQDHTGCLPQHCTAIAALAFTRAVKDTAPARGEDQA